MSDPTFLFLYLIYPASLGIFPFQPILQIHRQFRFFSVPFPLIFSFLALLPLLMGLLNEELLALGSPLG